MEILESVQGVRGARKMQVAAICFLIEKDVAKEFSRNLKNLGPIFFQSGNPKKNASIGRFRV